MPTAFQKLFNNWMSKNYLALRQQMPIRDLMHDAYVTVYEFRRPIIPTDERFKSLMDDAYHRHLLREMNHNMQFILPDPLFWMYLEEDGMQDDMETNDISCSLFDLSDNAKKQLSDFIRKKFSPEVYTIFCMAVYEKLSYAEIAKITGHSRAEIKNIIKRIEDAIRKCKRKK